MSWILDWLPWWIWWAAAGVAALLTFQLWFPIALAVWNLLPGWARAALIGAAGVITALLIGRNQGARNEAERQRQRDARAAQARVQSDARVDRMSDADKDKAMKQWQRD